MRLPLATAERPSAARRQPLEQIGLVLFFTRGMSLALWDEAGLLQRELALYRELQPHLGHLAFLTYGGAADLTLAHELPGVEILPNRSKLPSNLYSVLAPWLHRRSLSRASIFKTNQINGAWCAVIAKALFGKRLVLRCGFLWSDFMVRKTPSRWRHVLARRLERMAFRAADAVIVAGEPDRLTAIQRYGLDEACVHMVPNYVDTSRFRPMPEVARQPGRLTFVGRLEDQKNPVALIEALKGLPGVKLSIVGLGSLKSRLVELAREYLLDVEFRGAVPHEQLPALLNRSELFILPSHYEGNPKALVEAMACGVPVIAGRSPGIQEFIAHRETAFLCGTSPVEIRAALDEVLADAGLRERLAAQGLAYVRERFSLPRVVEQELSVLATVAKAGDQRVSR